MRAINASLLNLTTTERVVRGTVRDANGNPFVGGFVQLFSHGLAGETILGKSPVDAADASFTIAYTPPATAAPVAVRMDVRAAVFTPAGAVASTIPSGSSVLTNPGPLEVIDFVVEGDGVAAHSEVEQMIADIGPFVGSRPLDSLFEDDTRHDISVLAAQTGYTTQQIAALVTASQIASGAGVPAPVVYGLIRQGLPADLTALKNTHGKVRASVL